mgnify:FL=1|tara:strand:+ start:163 stop:1518 length:1356 start_codon:yes stop_codon:yes gene_type:complete
MNNKLMKIKDSSVVIYSLLIGLVFIFDRSFIGFMIAGQQIGKLIVGVGFLATFLFIILRFYNLNLLNLDDYSLSLSILSTIVLTFFISIFIHGTNVFSEYTFKTSSYIWTASILYISLVIFKDINRYNKLIDIFIYPILLIPFVHYVFSTGYYPNFVMDFFIKFSDKFTFNKASDVMMTAISINFVYFKVGKNKYYKLLYLVFSISLLLPLLLLMSRGSFLSALVFLFGMLIFHRKYLLSNITKSLSILLIGSITFIASTYNVGDVNFNFNPGFGEQTVQPLNDTIQEIAKKHDTRKAFLSLYFENGRLVSHDNTTNWRLDIWQDVIEDMNNKNILIRGYGYNEIIPVMLDPAAPGRLGRDGLNENVHNYFVNILARGGIFQLLLFTLFHLSVLNVWYQKNKNLEILIYFIPVMINSSLDITMEGVQFPFIYYSLLGIFFNFKESHIQKEE